MSKDKLLDEAKPWTKEQYDSMQEHAHKLGYRLITPYRKGLKNIKVGVIKTAPTNDTESMGGGDE